jgi:hypothetical protein
MSNYYKIAIENETESFRATKILNELLNSPEAIKSLMQTPWFRLLRALNRRFEQATYNNDGNKWIYGEVGTPGDLALQELIAKYPGLIEKEAVTELEFTKIRQEDS